MLYTQFHVVYINKKNWQVDQLVDLPVFLYLVNPLITCCPQ